MTQFKWAYYDSTKDQIVLVKKPYRRAFRPKYECIYLSPLPTSDQPYIRLNYFKVSRKTVARDFMYLGRLG